MADLQKTVEIIFGGRNDLSKTIGDVEKSLSSLNTATEPFADLAKYALKAEVAIIGMGVAAAGLSIVKAGEFGGQFAEITTLIDGSADSLADFRQAILDYAAGSTQSLSDITGAVYSAISAGIEYSDSLEVVAKAEQLAVAGKSTLKDAVLALEGPLNAYGASADQAGAFSDALFQAVAEGITTLPELAASLSKVTGLAANTGIEFGELLAALSALTSSSTPTSEAVTQIRAAIMNIISPSKQAAEYAAELGLEFSAAALQSKGFAGFMQDVAVATGGSTDKTAKLFTSVQALGGVLTLTGVAADKFSEALEGQANAAGATATAYEKMVAQFSLQNQKLANNVEIVLVAVGDKLLAGYGDIIKNLTANLQGITAAVNAGSFDGLIKIFQDVMKDIAKLLEGAAKTLPDAIAKINWDGLAGSFDSLKSALQSILTAMFGEVDLTNIDSMAAGMQKFVDAIANLTNINAGIISALPPLFKVIVEVMEQISKLSPEQFEMIGKGLGAALLLNMSTDGIANVATTIAAAAVSIKALAGINAPALAGVAAAMGQFALVLGSGFIGWQAGTEINNIIDSWVKKFSSTGADSLGAQIYDWIHGTGDKSVQKAADDLHAIDLNVMIPTFDTTGALVALKSVEEVARETALETSKIKWELDADGNIAGTVTKITDSIESITKTADPEFDNLKASFIALGNSPQVADAMARIELETQRIPDAVKSAAAETAAHSDQVIIELAKIDSAFAQKVLSLSVDLKVAEIEGETKRIQAAFSSIDNTITNTGETLSNLTGTLSTFASTHSSGYQEMLKIVQNEEKRRDDALDLQKDLTAAQVDLLKARTDRMKSGEAMITINGDGLAPELEAFMWQVLKAIQVQAADEESAFLLGI